MSSLKIILAALAFFFSLTNITATLADASKIGTWTTGAPAPTKRTEVAAAAVEGKIYVVGGFAKSLLSVWKAVPTVYQYDPVTSVWRELPQMPNARGALGVTVYRDRLYAIGGYDGEGNTAAVEVFDPQSNTWSTAASMPTPRDHLAVVTAGSRIYAIGGCPDLNYRQNMGVVEEYDPETDQWQTRAELPTARSGIAAGVIDGRIYVLGGESGQEMFAINEMYIPGTDKWRAVTPMPTSRHGLGAAVVDGRLYAISGGPTPGGSFSRVNEVFTPPVFAN